MKNKYKKTLIILALIITIVLLFLCSYILYKRNASRNTADVVIIDGLSINYLSGKKFSFNDDKKEIKFSIINDNDTPNTFDVVLKNLSFNGTVSYTIYENEKQIIKDAELKAKKSLSLLEGQSIDGLKTKSYRLIINNKDEKDIRFKLSISKSKEAENTLSKLVLNNSDVKEAAKTEIGSIANTDEGLILDVDDTGNTYYFRGDVKNNYVKIGDNLWRIVRVNGNGTVKIVLDNTVLNTTLYDSAHSKSTTLTKYSEMTIYNTLNDWYNENLKEVDEYIAPYKFCLDLNKTNDVLNNYIRINNDNNPTFNCLGEKSESKIGILTADEVIYAGASKDEANTNYYLYNSNITSAWWTLTPVKEEIFGIFFYDVNGGSMSSSSTGESTKALRPVINIKKDVIVTGKGLEKDPYTIK